MLLRRDVTEPVPDEDLEVSAPSALSESTREPQRPCMEGQDSPAVDEPWEGSDWRIFRRSWSTCDGQG